MKQTLVKLGTTMASLALMVTALNVNAACKLFVYHPKLPKKAKKLRKFLTKVMVIGVRY